MNPFCVLSVVCLSSFSGVLLSGAAGAQTIRISADRAKVGMGRTVIVTAIVTARNGKPAKGVELWPYVNGRRWGAQAFTDAQGRAALLLPLPNPGAANIRVAARPPKRAPDAYWIWAAETRDNQTVYFRREFSVTLPASRAALRITCDDIFTAWLNGHQVASGSNFQKVQSAAGLEKWLRPGRNVLTVEGTNGVGPAGLLARLEIVTQAGTQAIATDGAWQVSMEKPEDWPPAGDAENNSQSKIENPKSKISLAPAAVLAPAGGGVWGNSIRGWPGLTPRSDFPVGLPMPKGLACSNTVRVHVYRRPLRVTRDPEHLVGMEWEPWFTPLNARWDTAEAVPLIGNYDSFNPDVIRQHALWMTEEGVNFLLVDWTNNLWDKKHWSERAPGVNDLIRGTTTMLDVYAQMRKEGIPVPQVALILGLDNGPQTTMSAINEQIAWVYDTLVRNPRYQGLWLEHEGKPLILVFNGGGPGVRRSQPPVDDSKFTVRWISSQLQITRLDREGYWSWMDGAIHPVPTVVNGRVEALTVTIAFFAEGGWTYPPARGRRGGATYVEEFRTALEQRPKFLVLCQWNEFAGQPDGSGYGPKKDQYVDCYNAELSNDIEPTALNVPGYRTPEGGWGFSYHNLTRALVDMYHGKTPDATLLAVSRPAQSEVVAGPVLNVEWTALGNVPKGFTLKVDGRTAAREIQGDMYTLPVLNLAPGRHTLSIVAEGAWTRYRLSKTQEDDPLAEPMPASATVEFIVKR
jgi:hypothetical protein